MLRVCSLLLKYANQPLSQKDREWVFQSAASVLSPGKISTLKSCRSCGCKLCWHFKVRCFREAHSSGRTPKLECQTNNLVPTHSFLEKNWDFWVLSQAYISASVERFWQQCVSASSTCFIVGFFSSVQGVGVISLVFGLPSGRILLYVSVNSLCLWEEMTSRNSYIVIVDQNSQRTIFLILLLHF